MKHTFNYSNLSFEPGRLLERHGGNPQSSPAGTPPTLEKVPGSTTGAEYIAALEVAKEGVWIRNFLMDLSF
jgi:hypothetical protein